jgi:hypothetical protein
MEHFQTLREMQLERNDKYKLLKDSSAKKEISDLDRHYNNLHEQLVKEQSEAQSECSKKEQVLREIQTIKRNIKLQRQHKLDLEKSIHYSVLDR